MGSQAGMIREVAAIDPIGAKGKEKAAYRGNV